jgi:predicted DNA-binding transcriptional regulator YafY
MTLEPRICEAINSMKVIEFDYADKVGNIHHRIVEPYAHGVTRRGKDALRGYQIGGTSESEVPGWKLFVVERMIGLIITGRTFTGTAPDYALGDKDLSPIYCRVS